MNSKFILPCKSKADAFHNLKSLIRNLHENPAKPRSHFWPLNNLWRTNQFGEFSLNEEQTEVFLSILDALAPDCGAPAPRSREAIDDMISEYILSALNFAGEPTVSFEKHLSKLINGFKRSLNSQLTQWEIVGFLERIKVPSTGFQFGKILFCDHKHEAIKFYKDKTEKAQEESRKSKNPVIVAFPNPIDQFTFFRIFVGAGDDDAALQIAQFELETTLDALNFFASFFYLKDRLPALSEYQIHARQNALFSRKQNSEGFSIKFENKFFHEIFDALEISKDKDISLAFEKTNKLLLNSQNGLKERFLSAIKWAGKGSITRNRENAFIFYAIALEALLLGQKHHEHLSYKLRLRAAHLLGLKNSARSKICNRVSQLYSLRSKIVHSGSNKLSQSDLDELRIITQSCIIRLLSDPIFGDFSTEEDLEKWFEEMIIFGPEKT